MNHPHLHVPAPRPRGGRVPDGCANPDRSENLSRPVPAGPLFYLLVLHPLGGPGARRQAGWALETWQGGRPEASVALAALGAGAQARPRVAQALAVQVLSEQGVPVRGWRLCSSDIVPMFLARLSQGSNQASACGGDLAGPEVRDCAAKSGAPSTVTGVDQLLTPAAAR